MKRLLLLCAMLMLATASYSAESAKIRVLLIDGQNNHNWKATTPVMKKYLDDTTRFETTIATTPTRPGKDGNMDEYKKQMIAFKPDLSKFDVVVSNYNGDSWSKEFNDDLDAKLKEGKVGLVIVHAANNAFGGWKEWNQMIGLGWRDKSFGKRLKLTDEGKEVFMKIGEDGSTSHKYTGDFAITIRDKNHPVTNGMPTEWMHHRDELYDNLRGPAENIKVLATAMAPKGKGTDVHEPMIFTIDYGKGRVFHTPMGHDANSMRCVGFASTLQRGTEWAATGKVTIELPKNFPTAEKSSLNPEK